jgi:hypothetical protein
MKIQGLHLMGVVQKNKNKITKNYTLLQLMKLDSNLLSSGITVPPLLKKYLFFDL